MSVICFMSILLPSRIKMLLMTKSDQNSNKNKHISFQYPPLYCIQFLHLKTPLCFGFAVKTSPHGVLFECLWGHNKNMVRYSVFYFPYLDHLCCHYPGVWCVSSFNISSKFDVTSRVVFLMSCTCADQLHLCLVISLVFSVCVSSGLVWCQMLLLPQCSAFQNWPQLGFCFEEGMFHLSVIFLFFFFLSFFVFLCVWKKPVVLGFGIDRVVSEAALLRNYG